MTKYGLVIDQERCIGCHACAVTCKQENNVPMGQYWNRVLTEGGDKIDTPAGTYPEHGEDGTLDMGYQPTACQHCENAPCVKVCPVNATYTRDDGIVEIDYDKCIGCRYCMAACPYNARVFNWEESKTIPEEGTGDVPARPQGVVEKCTFCSHRVDEGLDPACVVNCPADARIFGDLDNEESTVSRYIKKYETHRLLEDRGTDPKTYYIRGEMSPGRPQTSDKMESELDEEDLSTWTPPEEPSADESSGAGASHGSVSADAMPHVPVVNNGGDD
ncbi:4Fe-4S dicluster domain-containing protein [Haloferax mediterranei ATCC 33500]|uniref:4Fe-4S dicluster domain-containing protein n=1 Tax=Haloferax mediterranei (strain ATCC 33500 / DSM 1411 / JCM 8866 / NBRC 14739 / NCIMB 2177 / R-4) TaxID=523841 RepID=I3R6N9_HALMT|nr:4Fe-4S dicluster domain-containing protein [Haloferax mediterranei]AFK19899.1 molybdopterin oxidoreductase [Haloferax mediterranei ATCC 33500]AHZ23278.1 4Fe-4S ferredoxin [Haloferax mediterranei ATCC 33500]ELZ99443.1 molybdopterin oxidoreductase [Haloferax mediterranei ATCC 33500]MDX5987352.1 4Fe-4S dicluster domain-containing protein [Haloferax mediterranei ATCC 33500]QCQ73863.1 4Fe-4S dicluster domain-containing protein [Haloferax mediterranei ATCC 33500]